MIFFYVLSFLLIFQSSGTYASTENWTKTRGPRPNRPDLKTDLGKNNPFFWDLFVLNKLTTKKIITEEQLAIPLYTVAPNEDNEIGQIILLNGIPFYFDPNRNSWLSFAQNSITAALSGSQSDTYLALPDAVEMDSNGVRIPYQSTITGATIQSEQGTIWRVASVGGDFPDLATAIASPAVTAGTDSIALAEETFIIPATIDINKSLFIYGEGPGSVLTTAGTAADPTPVLSITADDVTLKNLTVRQQKTVNTSTETVSTISTVQKTVLDSLIIETMEFGVQVSGTSFSIKNCEFHYIGPLGNNHRFIRVGPHNGTSFIKNNTFYPSADTGNGRTRFCYINGTPLAGTIVFDNNQQAGTGRLSQFFLQDAMSGSLSLYFVNNIYNDQNGGIIFYGGINMLNSLTQVVIANNHVTNTSNKGLVTLDGWGGPGLNLGTTNWFIANNIIDNPSLAAPFLDATATPAEIAYDGGVFSLPSLITPSTTIPATPEELPRFSLDIYKKNNPTRIATLPVYEFGNQSTTLNTTVAQGEILQLFLNGSAISPVAQVYLQASAIPIV